MSKKFIEFEMSEGEPIQSKPFDFPDEKHLYEHLIEVTCNPTGGLISFTCTLYTASAIPFKMSTFLDTEINIYTEANGYFKKGNVYYPLDVIHKPLSLIDLNVWYRDTANYLMRTQDSIYGSVLQSSNYALTDTVTQIF